MNIPNKPRGWRNGQTIFNFLAWLKDWGYATNERMADPFNIPDDKLEELYKLFIACNGTEYEIKQIK